MRKVKMKMVKKIKKEVKIIWTQFKITKNNHLK